MVLLFPIGTSHYAIEGLIVRPGTIGVKRANADEAASGASSRLSHQNWLKKRKSFS
jgi:hypothetical protein